MKEWILTTQAVWGTMLLLVVLIVVNLITKLAVVVKDGSFQWGQVLKFLWTDVAAKFMVYVALLMLLQATKYLPEAFPPGVTDLVAIAVVGVYIYLFKEYLASIWANVRANGLPAPGDTGKS